MPDEDGCSLIRKIRLLEPEQGGQVPAIALTASVGEQNRSLAIEAGISGTFSKIN
jgi:CheY-like chemotaxis protein